MASTTDARTTVLNYLKAVANSRDGTMLSFMSENYESKVIPAFENGPPPFTRETFAAHLKTIEPILKGFRITPLDIVVDEKQTKVVVIGTAEPIFREEVMDNEVDWKNLARNTYVITLDKTGQKVDGMVEYMDTTAMKELMVLIQRAFENHAKNNGN